MRIGIGYDIHRLVPGRRLVLGGVALEYERGLQGHSDADALIHAVCDAILGAIAHGDIGTHFPDDDPRFYNIDSAEILKKVYSIMREAGYDIENLDSTIMAEEPKLSPHIQPMRERLASILSVDISRISVKATRGEGVGPVGRKEAIEAIAIVCLKEIKKT